MEALLPQPGSAKRRDPNSRFTTAIEPNTNMHLQSSDKMLSRMDPERIEKIQSHIQGIGTVEGIMFRFGGKTGNTKFSHQLLQLAKTDSLEMQWKVAEEVFRLHLEEERDITDIQMLVAAGVNAGLGEEKVRKWLQDEEGAKIVDKEVEEVRALGVKGVPRFLLQGGKHHVEGAGDVMDFFEVFMKVKEGESSK
jgi:predicted DsbA family dithiol-disulfide isomerase